jgi:Protein of unknown function (DUF1573)
MKFILSSVFTLVLYVLAAAQTPAIQTNNLKEDNLKLKETAFDFGKIAQGKPVTHIFEVVNTGNDILSLENVQASCGCTTPEWSKDPIAPGATQKITVGYNAATEGPFEKSITVFYNKGQMKTILIKGNVWKTPDQSAPKNNSIAIFKN